MKNHLKRVFTNSDVWTSFSVSRSDFFCSTRLWVWENNAERRKFSVIDYLRKPRVYNATEQWSFNVQLFGVVYNCGEQDRLHCWEPFLITQFCNNFLAERLSGRSKGVNQRSSIKRATWWIGFRPPSCFGRKLHQTLTRDQDHATIY